MPTRKQRRRAAKGKRHEYETVWVDAEGNELEEPPEETLAQERDGKGKSRPDPVQKGKPQGRGGRAARVPPPPSWQRAGKRALLLGAVVFALFYLSGGRSGNRIVSALGLAAIYTALFVPFTYAIDRFAYTRWQRREQAEGKQKPARKR
jgi:hypothetical protein